MSAQHRATRNRPATCRFGATWKPPQAPPPRRHRLDPIAAHLPTLIRPVLAIAAGLVAVVAFGSTVAPEVPVVDGQAALVSHQTSGGCQ